MKKIFTLVASAALAIPMLSAAEKTMKVELLYHNVATDPFEVYGTFDGQKITYDENTKEYTLVNFIGWEGANLVFKIGEEVSSNWPKDKSEERHPILVQFQHAAYADAKAANDIILQNSLGSNKENTEFCVNTTEHSGIFKGEYSTYYYAGGAYFNCNSDVFTNTDLIGVKPSNMIYRDQTQNTYALINDGKIELYIGSSAFTKTIFEGTEDGTDFVAKLWTTNSALKFTFAEELNGDIQEDPEPSEGTHTFNLYTAVNSTYPYGSSNYDYRKLGEKLGSAKGNVTYNADDQTYTIENLFGYEQGNFTFTFTQSELGQTKFGSNVLKASFKSLIGEDRRQLIPAYVNPAIGSETLGSLATRWYRAGTNGIWYIFGASDEPFNQDTFNANGGSFSGSGSMANDVKIVPAVNEAQYYTWPFMGETNDYTLLRPDIANNASTNTMTTTPRVSAERMSFVKVNEDGTHDLCLLVRTGGYLTKAAGASDWTFNEDNEGYYYVVCNLEGAADAGVAEIEIDENAPVEYYNLQGIRVENPTAGLYIRRQGKNVQKIVIR